MDTTLVSKVECIRSQFPNLRINSAYRTFGHNLKVGGAEGSDHKSGRAVDLSVRVSTTRQPTDEFRYEIVKLALSCGCNQIGIHKNFVHVGYNNNKRQRLWLY